MKPRQSSKMGNGKAPNYIKIQFKAVKTGHYVIVMQINQWNRTQNTGEPLLCILIKLIFTKLLRIHNNISFSNQQRCISMCKRIKTRSLSYHTQVTSKWLKGKNASLQIIHLLGRKQERMLRHQSVSHLLKSKSNKSKTKKL